MDDRACRPTRVRTSPAAGRRYARLRDMPKIVTVWAPKGGVGKTTLAYEIAYALGGVLVDLEWDDGGARVQWGIKEPEPSERARLLRGFRTGQPPRPLRAERRPDL